jgi:hypothetical protein
MYEPRKENLRKSAAKIIHVKSKKGNKTGRKSDDTSVDETEDEQKDVDENLKYSEEIDDRTFTPSHKRYREDEPHVNKSPMNDGEMQKIRKCLKRAVTDTLSDEEDGLLEENENRLILKPNWDDEEE